MQLTDYIGESVDASLVGFGRSTSGVSSGGQANHADLRHRCSHLWIVHQHRLQITCTHDMLPSAITSIYSGITTERHADTK